MNVFLIVSIKICTCSSLVSLFIPCPKPHIQPARCFGDKEIKVSQKNNLSDPPSDIKFDQSIGHWEIGKQLGIIDFERGV